MKYYRAFTLIELLVVIAVIALLLAILVPSLGRARANARAVKCGASMHSVGQAVVGYQAENDDTLPPSYVYPNASDSWNLHNQQNPPVNGYEHWSSFLIGTVDSKAFTCPEFDSGGIPRTNPGPTGTFWTDGQIDQNGQTQATPTSIEDKQAPFCAFAANEALMPRNKFDAAARDSDPSTTGGDRLNIFVKGVNVAHPGTVILLTEFDSNWRTIAVAQGGGQFKAVGHRPIMPFGLLGSSNEFAVPPTAFFTNVNAASLYDSTNLASRADSNACLIQDSIQLNAVGRNHPGSSSAGGKGMGGNSNFLYLDGHVELKSVVDTLNKKEWGDRFYTIDGDNTIR